MGVVLFSSQPDYLRAAGAALTEKVSGSHVERLGPDVAALASPAEVEDVAGFCLSTPIPFVRHLMAEDARVGIDQTTEAAVAAVAAAKGLGLDSVGLQVWTSGDVPVKSEQLRAELVDVLEAGGVRTERRGTAHVLGVCVTLHGVSLGVTDTSAMLCDWPGGRVRLRAGKEQISRAEFKLEELLQLHPLELARGGAALDLGASPGGWTRLLRTYGLEVVAVDPGDLASSLRRDRGVDHVRTTAGRYLRQPGGPFDIVVNDMRMTPKTSAQVVVDAAAALRPDGLAVMTLKVTPRTAQADLHAALSLLSSAYDVVFARQLHHNRNEITLVLRRR